MRRWPHGRKNGMFMMVISQIRTLSYFGCLTDMEELSIMEILEHAKQRADEEWDLTMAKVVRK